MRNFDTFYAANSKYGKRTTHFSEPSCFEDKIHFKTIPALGLTKEIAAINLAKIIHMVIEEAPSNMKVSLEGITDIQQLSNGTWVIKAQFKYQTIKSPH